MLIKQYNILLVGDNCEDRYQFGYVDRISPEAPVPVFRFSHDDFRPGMAGNVYQNLIALGCCVDFNYDQISLKTRLIDIRSKQQLLRIDHDLVSQPLDLSARDLSDYNAIVVSDYNKGTIDYATVQDLRQRYTGPIFVDTKKTDLAKFEGCIVKINNLEYSLTRSQCSNLIVTRGRDGAVYQGTEYLVDEIDVVDVCGAGDTFLAALCVGYLSNHADIPTAIKFANRAAAVTVQHTGVYAPTMEEICGS